MVVRISFGQTWINHAISIIINLENRQILIEHLLYALKIFSLNCSRNTPRIRRLKYYHFFLKISKKYLERTVVAISTGP